MIKIAIRVTCNYYTLILVHQYLREVVLVWERHLQTMYNVHASIIINFVFKVNLARP